MAYEQMNKTCVYTCITGNYDQLQEPKVVSPGIDYICFTDSPIRSNVWKRRSIPEELRYLSNVKKQRVVKICPHRYLSEYDISVWIDGNISIVGDIREFIQQYDLEKSPLYTRIHPSRNCIYDEAEACIKLKKDAEENVKKQIQRYKDEHYPEKIGMVETCILLRKHNDEKCILIDNAWATELLQQSHRDQLSFNYVCWKNNFFIGFMTKEFKINDSDYFRITTHAKRI